MRKSYYLLILILMMNVSMILTASSQEQVAQTIFVYDGDFNGTLLSDVQVDGQDATGNMFGGITDSNGAVVINGQPGTWQFTFAKEGYSPLNLNYDVTETGEGAVYLQRASQLQEQGQVTQTVYVHDGDFNGTLLSDVQVTGRDGAGNSFQGVTNPNGVVAISGKPGTWQLTFAKEGYDTASLNYDVTETQEAEACLQRTAQSQEYAIPSQAYQQSTSQSIPQPTQQNSYQSTANALYRKGVALDAQEKYEEAFEAYDEATKIDPQFDMAWYNKAMVLKKLGRQTESEEALAKVRDLSYNPSI